VRVDKTKNLFVTKQPPEKTKGHIIRVAFQSAVDKEFDYLVPDNLWPIQNGQRVEAPFGRANKLTIGFCVETDIDHRDHRDTQRKKRRKFELKSVRKVVDERPLLDTELLELARWIAGYYICPLGQVLSAMVPAAVKKKAGVKKERLIYLTDESEKLTETIKGKKQKQIVALLKQLRAIDPASAVKLNSVLEIAGSTKSPLAKLVDNRIVRVASEEFFPELPVIPRLLLKKLEEDIAPNADQQKALDIINDKIDSERFSVTLLHGVTDSGKTELYIRAIQHCLTKGKGAIVLLPEIALTTQTVQRFSSRFERLALMHSGLTAAQRNIQWQKIKAGRANVVIGARSAVFAPLKKLGLIVIDEEHEPSYKQDTLPRYHGRDVAVKRAQLADAHCILGSATPSLETLANCKNKQYFNLIRLPKRVMDLPGPQMKLVDMRTQPYSSDGINLISEPLAKHLEKTLAKGEQAILLLNRRGYSNFIYCPACRYTADTRCTAETATLPLPSTKKDYLKLQVPQQF